MSGFQSTNDKRESNMNTSRSVCFPCYISVWGDGCQWKGSEARTLSAGGTSLTPQRCCRTRRCLGSRNTFKNGKKNAILIGGRAAFHNRCGLQYSIFVIKRRIYSLFLRKCRLQGQAVRNHPGGGRRYGPPIKATETAALCRVFSVIQGQAIFQEH